MKNFEQLDVITALSEMPNKNDKMKEKFEGQNSEFRCYW